MSRPSHPPIVYVEWMDSHGASDGWTPKDESVEFGIKAISGPLVTAGLLVADNPNGIVVAVAYNEHADDVDGAIAIPRSAIVRMVQLRAAHGMEQV